MSTRVAIAVVLLCGRCAPNTEGDAGAASDGGAGSDASGLNYAILTLPQENPVAIVVASYRGQIVFYVSDYDEPFAFTALRTYRLVWSPDAGFVTNDLIDVIASPGYNSFEPATQSWPTGALGGPSVVLKGRLKYPPADGGRFYRDRLRLFSEGGPLLATEVSTCNYGTYADYTASDRVAGAASPDGRAWLLHYSPSSASCARQCGNNIELWRREPDGGAAGPFCPFRRDFVEVGTIQYRPGGIYQTMNLHPTLRVGAANDIVFFSFDEDGRLQDFVMTDAGFNTGSFVTTIAARFWPTEDLPVRRLHLHGETRWSGTTEERRISLVESRWVDGGVERVQSPLGGLLHSIRAISETSRGVVIVGEVYDANPDGGEWFDAEAKRSTRILLVSRDGQRLLAKRDMWRGPSRWIVEGEGRLFAFEDDGYRTDAGAVIRQVRMKELDL